MYNAAIHGRSSQNLKIEIVQISEGRATGGISQVGKATG